VKISIQLRTFTLAICFTVLFGIASSRAAEPAIGVLTLHGVGSHGEDSDFDAKLRKMLQEKAGEKTKVVVKTVVYHGESRNRQAKLWKEFDRLEDRNPSSLDQKIIRRILLMNLSDALAYANNPTDKNSFYRTAHGKVRDAINELEAELGDGVPVAVVAHSLGCKVIFDYLCDAQTGAGIWKDKKPPREFQKLVNLRVLITTGCNLPLFESAVPTTEQRFFRASKDFQWINFYDRDDLLGWPLRPLGGRFKDIVQDQERNKIGSTLTSHVKYWRDDKLNEEIADKILKLTQTNAPDTGDE
jgi:hypothetical protein